MTSGRGAREALLERCLTYLQQNGFSQRSLREIAAGTGTSHRMILYHFGSRDGLLAAVVGRIEAEQRAALADLTDATDNPIEVGRLFWQRLADPALAPAERLFFEIYAQALFGQPWTQSFRASVIEAWTRPIEEQFVRQGFTPAEARRRTRLALAAIRGLLLDLLITGDRQILDEAAELFAHLLTSPDPASAPLR
ncbi:MAG TPA: TetR/AcrR family transcriptional regulator [Micromonosporaceae bacterium]|nr:TetR/AcrR family transcriptional regulator [Micromonosporaceae bacterium]